MEGDNLKKMHFWSISTNVLALLIFVRALETDQNEDKFSPSTLLYSVPLLFYLSAYPLEHR